MYNPFQVVKDFEHALCDYTGAPYVVTTTSCTMALLLAVAWHFRENRGRWVLAGDRSNEVEIPKRTYVGVPMSIIHAGGRPTFRDEDWVGAYQLKPLPVWDSARWFTGGLYKGAAEAIFFSRGNMNELNAVKLERNCAGSMVCVSFHWAKTLGIQQGGAILLDNREAAQWLQRARFDGRAEGVPPKAQNHWELGWHCYMAPETAAAGLVRLANLPRHNEPIPWDDYPDLSTFELFK